MRTKELLNELNKKRGIKTAKEKGYLFLLIENSIFNIMMLDGPMFEYGGCSTVKSFGIEKDCEIWLKNQLEVITKKESLWHM